MENPQPQLATDATTDDLASAVADEMERRQHVPTVRETMREKARQLRAIKVDHNGRVISG